MTTTQLRRLLEPIVMPTAVLAQVFAELDRIDRSTSPDAGDTTTDSRPSRTVAHI